MAKIAIMRWNMNNDYLFIAEQQEKDLLSNVSVYVKSVEYGVSKKSYEHAAIIDNGTGLGVYNKCVVFSGNEVFPIYDITNEVFRDIFDHTNDLERMIQEGKNMLGDHSYSPLFGFEKRRKRSEKNWQIVCEKYDALMRKFEEKRPTRPEFFEFYRAVEASYKAGFDKRTINGQPRVNTGLVELVRA
jgi:hypothetical protein